MARIYCAGPMRGYDNFNFPAFNVAAEELRALGWDVVNPVDINPDPNTPYAECMRKDIEQLLTCDSIYMLTGWEKSQGATLEHSIALSLEFDIYYEDDDLAYNNNENKEEGETPNDNDHFGPDGTTV